MCLPPCWLHSRASWVITPCGHTESGCSSARQLRWTCPDFLFVLLPFCRVKCFLSLSGFMCYHGNQQLAETDLRTAAADPVASSGVSARRSSTFPGSLYSATVQFDTLPPFWLATSLISPKTSEKSPRLHAGRLKKQLVFPTVNASSHTTI